MIFNNFFILLLSQCFLFTLAKNNVVFVFEHFRHGARSPSTLNENDVDGLNQTWNGLQELSNVGLRQHYLLGNYIRNKYPDLINYKNYNPKEIEVLSTITNRTIMSARAQLHGIFNNSRPKKIEGEQVNTCLPYYLLDEKDKYNINNISLYPDNFPEEVPVHIVDIKDKLIQLEKTDECPVIKKIRAENKKRKEFKDFCQKFNSTFGEKLLRLLHIEDQNYFIDYENVNDICIETIIDVFDGRNLTIINQEIDIDSLFNMSMEFFRLKANLVYANNNNGTLAYVGSSILMRKILSYMEKIIDDINNKVNDSPKLVLLSSHDTAICSMEGLLSNLFNVTAKEPTFAASFIFELSKEDQENKYTVNLIFNNELIKSLNYDDFKNRIKTSSWTYEQTAKYCGFKEEKKEIIKEEGNTSDSLWLNIIIIFSLLDSLVIIVIAFLLIKRNNKKYSLDSSQNL